MANVSDWRLTAATIYKKPTDSRILGSVEIDATVLEEFIQQKRREGIKLTPTLLLALATARVIRRHVPEFNMYMKRGTLQAHQRVDAAISVLQKDGQMGAAILPHADRLTASQGVEALQQQIREVRQHRQATAGKNLLARIPWPFRGWLFQAVRFLTVVCGWRVLGISANTYGSFIVSNIGSLGLDMGYPALLPVANVSVVLIVGSIKPKPWVVDGRLEVRTVLSLGAAIDHRIVDASHAARLFHHLKGYLQNPGLLEKIEE